MAVSVEHLHGNRVFLGTWSGTMDNEDLNIYYTELAALAEEESDQPVFSVQVLDNVTGIPANSVSKFVSISRSFPERREAMYTVFVVDKTLLLATASILSQIVRCKHVMIVRDLDEALSRIKKLLGMRQLLS